MAATPTPDLLQPIRRQARGQGIPRQGGEEGGAWSSSTESWGLEEGGVAKHECSHS